MDIKEIPKILFEEFRKFTKGEERRVPYDRLTYRLLEFTIETAGCKGAIGLSEDKGHGFVFSLWSDLPSGTRVISVPPMFEIKSGAYRVTDSPRSDKGYLIKEGARVQIKDGSGGAPLENPVMKLMAKILEGAVELAAEATRNIYWEADR